jgi:hypothetical protein
MANKRLLGILMVCTAVFLMFLYFSAAAFMGFGLSITGLIHPLGRAFSNELGVTELLLLFARIALHAVCIGAMVLLAVYGNKFITGGKENNGAKSRNEDEKNEK